MMPGPSARVWPRLSRRCRWRPSRRRLCRAVRHRWRPSRRRLWSRGCNRRGVRHRSLAATQGCSTIRWVRHRWRPSRRRRWSRGRNRRGVRHRWMAGRRRRWSRGGNRRGARHQWRPSQTSAEGSANAAGVAAKGPPCPPASRRSVRASACGSSRRSSSRRDGSRDLNGPRIRYRQDPPCQSKIVSRRLYAKALRLALEGNFTVFGLVVPSAAPTEINPLILQLIR